MRVFGLLIVICLIAVTSNAQSFRDEDPEYFNFITLTVGYTFVPNGEELTNSDKVGILVPSIGLDYGRRLNNSWAIGIMTDLELANYLVINKDLQRDRAFIIIVNGIYNLTYNWKLVGGMGVELERHKNLFVIRLGTDYDIRLKNGWGIAPGFFYDFKESYDTWCFSIAIGKEF